jgi:hypothetical protein
VKFKTPELELVAARELSGRALHGVPSVYRTELQSITAIIAEKIRNDDLFKVHRTRRVTFLSVGDQIEIRRKLALPDLDADLRAELQDRLSRHVKYRPGR